jgi:hypothetical protein
MRDRRSSVGPAPEVKEDPALAKLKDLNLIAKTEVVHEEPGDEKGFFSRVAGKLNPFSSSSSPKKEEKIEPSALDLLAKRNQAQKKKEEESSGILASLWPFGSKDSKPSTASSDPKANNFVSQIDDSLKQKGIDSAPGRTALKPPVADLPNTDDMAAKPPQTTDTATLLSSVDANLKKSGKNGAELPTPPEAAAGFKDVAVIQAATAKAPQNQPSQDVQTSGILSSIDQKLKAQGLEPAKFEKPPTTEELKTASAQKPPVKNVELEPKFALEKGPLYLSPAEVESQEKPAAKEETKKIDNVDGSREIPSRVLVKGPVDPQSAAARTKSPATRQASAAQDDEPKGVFDQIRQDVESVSKVLNPFSW